MLFWLFLVLIASIVYLIKKQYSYWDSTNIPHLKNNFPLGIMTPVAKQKRPFGLVISDIYKKSNEKILGIYLFFRPYLLIRDARVARQILTNEFSSFHDRGVYVDEKHDPLSENLLALPGQKWRNLRTKLTPSFTSGKLKGMFETIDDVGDKMVKYIKKELDNSSDGKAFDMKEIMTTYAVDIIGSVIFGLDIDSFGNPDNEVRRIHADMLKDRSIFGQLFNFFSFLSPPLAVIIKRLGYKLPPQERMREIMKRTIKLREEHQVNRKDLLQLLVQLRNSGKVSDNNEEMWKIETAAENLKSMSIDSIVGNSFFFYMAGTETTSATASLAIIELSMYPELLKRAQDEVKEVLEKHGLKPDGKYTYDALQDMKFVELCLMETTRKYPGLPFMNRVCTQDFKVPDTKYTIKKGTPVLIPLFGLQNDPEYFPDPQRFDPERFLEESKNYDPTAYMPFGEGPRHCIAERMGKLNSKLAVVKILANFDIESRERKDVEFEFHVAPVLVTKSEHVKLSKKV